MLEILRDVFLSPARSLAVAGLVVVLFENVLRRVAAVTDDGSRRSGCPVRCDRPSSHVVRGARRRALARLLRRNRLALVWVAVVGALLADDARPRHAVDPPLERRDAGAAALRRDERLASLVVDHVGPGAVDVVVDDLRDLLFQNHVALARRAVLQWGQRRAVSELEGLVLRVPVSEVEGADAPASGRDAPHEQERDVPAGRVLVGGEVL